MKEKTQLKELFGIRGNPFLDALESPIPFYIPGISFSCTATRCKRHPDDSTETVFLLRSADGLEAEYSCRVWNDTGTAEFSGKLRNTGSAVSPLCRGPLSLMACFDYPGEIRMRTITGGANLSDAVPSPAYHISDTTGPVSLHGGKWSGRSTEQEMPYAVFTDEQETAGFFVVLEWSGRWILGAMRKNGKMSVWAHPAGTNFRLTPGEEIDLPRVELGFFSGNLQDGGNALRRHFAKHIRRENVLPVFFNHYYAFSGKFDENDLKKEADFYASIGCEYFVVDGGWFVKGFRKGIGNWEEPDPEIFPSGLDHFADYVRSLGMKFGLWFEPEFAMADSSWAKQHPEYYMEAKGRFNDIYCIPYGTGLYRFHDPDARKFMLDFFIKTVKKYGIRWIRWDCNEGLSDFWDANESMDDVGKIHYLYITGLYRFLDDFRAACPEVHIETCAGGGNRMDAGLLRRADSAWMNDNVWVHSARSYQKSLNSFVPGYSNSIFRPWVPFETIPMEELYSRFAGALGFSERAKNFSEQAARKMKELVARYKQIRHLLLKDFYPLFMQNSLTEPDGWQFHDPETGEGIFCIFRCKSPESAVRVRLHALSAGKYEAEDISSGKKLKFEAETVVTVCLERVSDCALFHYHKMS